MPLIISNEIATELITMKECMESLECVYKEEARGGSGEPKQVGHSCSNPRFQSLVPLCHYEGASLQLGFLALRIKTDMVYWQLVNGIHRELWYTSRPGKYGGLILLFSIENGELLAILNDGFVQHMRVVGTYALGAKYMSRPDTRVVGILGSGGMARGYLEALSLVRAISKVKVFSPTRENREKYAREMGAKLNLDIVAVGSIEEAARDVDHLASMTDAVDPIIQPHFLNRGMHLCTVTTQEMSPEAYRRIDRMVAHRTALSEHLFVTDQRPRQLGGSHSRTSEWESVVPVKISFADLLLDRVLGRESDKEVTYFVSEGMGTQFAAVAGLIYKKAKERGVGREIPLDWFVQDVRT